MPKKLKDAAITSKKKTFPSPKLNITDEFLKEKLNEFFGFSEFKDTQLQVIKSILARKNTFVIMPTGGGKSLCYQLPGLILDGCTIVVSPLIALMKNQVDLIRGYSENSNIAHFLNSSLNKGQIKTVQEDLKSGKTKILYVAPETLTKEENLDFFSELKISLLAVDEAHCISEWGHDFRPEYANIKKIVQKLKYEIPIIALTATATEKVRFDIIKNLELNKPVVYISSFNRPNLYYEIVPKINKETTIKHIVKYIYNNRNKSGIIYTLNRRSTEELAELLMANGIKAVAYHAGLEQKLRTQRQDDFLNETVQVIVATIAFGMGIDKPDIRYVIHYNIPKSIENYYQETGRAGRDGLEGNCILYYSYNDIAKLEGLMRDKPLSEREIGAQLINDSVAYAETSICRRKFLLHYFGEHCAEDNCQKCDNCLQPKEKIEAKNDVVILLKIIKNLQERYISDYIVNMLVGKATPQIKMYRGDSTPLFGSGKHQDELYWQSLVRNCLIHNLIKKDIEEFGLLKLTPHGEKFIKTPHSFMFSLNHVYTGEDSGDNDDDDSDYDSVQTHITSKDASAGALDETLFNMLKNLRQTQAKKLGLPSYVLFLENSLQDMSTFYPTTLDKLEKCQGVSKGKALKYGQPFIDLIKTYIQENNIDVIDDFVMKSVNSKSVYKIQIIQSIDKKLGLDIVAKNNNMRLDELLEEIENIVSSGTKLNLNYAVNDLLEPIDQEEIKNYFLNHESSSIQLAQEALAEFDYTWEQIKLMHIKFLNEIGH